MPIFRTPSPAGRHRHPTRDALAGEQGELKSGPARCSAPRWSEWWVPGQFYASSIADGIRVEEKTANIVVAIAGVGMPLFSLRQPSDRRGRSGLWRVRVDLLSYYPIYRAGVGRHDLASVDSRTGVASTDISMNPPTKRATKWGGADPTGRGRPLGSSRWCRHHGVRPIAAYIGEAFPAGSAHRERCRTTSQRRFGGLLPVTALVLCAVTGKSKPVCCNRSFSPPSPSSRDQVPAGDP